MAGKSSKGRRKPKASDLAVGLQPTTRTFTRWTTSLLRTAEIRADGGELRYAANLCDWVMADDRVAGTLQTRVHGLLGLSPTFEKSGDRRRSARAVRALEADEDYWEAYPESELALMLSWGIILGVVPFRHTWPVDEDTGRVLPCPTFWHPQHLRYDILGRRWLIRVAASGMAPGTGIEEELVPGDGTWILHTPYGTDRPQMLGLWRGLAPWVLLKHLAMQDWSRHGERAATLTAWHTDPEKFGSEPEERAKLAQQIFELGQSSVVVLPPGFNLKLVEATANTSQLFRNQIEAANTAIAISIRGGNLTTEVQAGSRAAAEAQERLGDDVKRRWDGESLTSTLHDQSLVWWAEYNFGDSALAPCPVYPTGPKRDLASKANSISAAAVALEKFEQLGFELDGDGQGFIDEFELNGIVNKRPPGFKPALPPATEPKKIDPKEITDPTLTG